MLSDPLIEMFKLGMDRDVIAPIPWEYWGSILVDDVPVVAENPLVLNVGAGKKLIDGAVAIDLPEWNANTMPLPFDDETVSGIHAYHFLEHVDRPADVLFEFQRVMKLGAFLNIVVPYYSAQLQAADITHQTAFCEKTWRNLFNNKYYDPLGKSHQWCLLVRTNVIMGVVERNLALLTQMVKVDTEGEWRNES